MLSTQQQILELDLSNLLSSCEFTENVLRYGNEAEIMLVKPQIVNRLENLNNHESQCEPEDNQVRSLQIAYSVTELNSQLIALDLILRFQLQTKTYPHK